VDELKSSGKPFDISKQEVWEAYRQVKANKGAPGALAPRAVQVAATLQQGQGVLAAHHRQQPSAFAHWAGLLWF
jgi:hypothetical protein